MQDRQDSQHYIEGHQVVRIIINIEYVYLSAS